MKQLIYALLDKKLGHYDLPRTCRDEREVRALVERAVKTNAIPTAFASDYDVYALGVFDDSNGKIEVYDVEQFICNGSEFIDKE